MQRGASQKKITVPNINSTDMHERIAARRARISSRIEKKKNKDSGETEGRFIDIFVNFKENKDSADAPKLGTGEKAKKQIEDSKQAYYSILAEAKEDVLSILKQTEDAEVERKKDLNQKDQARSDIKQQAEKEAQEIDQTVSSRWTQVLQKKIPQELLQVLTLAS